jgi:hypothetical protein
MLSTNDRKRLPPLRPKTENRKVIVERGRTADTQPPHE